MRVRAAWSSSLKSSGPVPLAIEPNRPQLLGHLVGGLGDLFVPFFPGPVDAQEHAGKPGHASRVGRGKIGPAEEWLALGSQEHRHRPAAVPGHGHDGRHVDLVEVGSLFAVDLDVDEVLVHQGSDLGVLEALVLHHVTPVTC